MSKSPNLQRLKKTAEIKPPLRSELHCQPACLPSAANAARPFRVCVPNGLGRGRKLANHSSAPSFSSLSPWRRDSGREREVHDVTPAGGPIPFHLIIPSFLRSSSVPWRQWQSCPVMVRLRWKDTRERARRSVQPPNCNRRLRDCLPPEL